MVCVLAALALAIGGARPVLAQAEVDKTVLIIRHAEPDDGQGLSGQGEARARAYARSFRDLTLEGKPARIGYLFAAIDSDSSMRPRMTLEPTAEALGLPIDSGFRTRQVGKLVRAVRELPAGAVALVAWRHGEIPELLDSFGVDPDALLPDGKWPNKVFDWLIALQFDASGKLLRSHRLSLDSGE